MIDTQPTIQNAQVQIVYDPKSKRIRAKFHSGWVRFPKSLRQHGNVYLVPELRPGKKGSWIACGKIVTLH